MRVGHVSRTLARGSRVAACRRVAALLCGLVLWFVGGERTSLANPAAESLIREGLNLRRSGRDADALKKLQEAYDLAANPRAAAQLGLCFQALGRWSEADAKLAEALSAFEDAWIKRNRDALKEQSELVKTHVGRVEILAEPTGALVSVNGRPVGSVPLADAVPVNEGLVDVEVSAEGYGTMSRSLTIAGESYQRLMIRLVKLEPPVTSSKFNPTLFRDDERIETTGRSTNDGAESDRGSVLRSPWFWVGAAVVVAAGAIVAVLASSGGTESPAVDDFGALK